MFHQLGLSYPEFVGGIYEDIIRKKQAYVLENIDKIIFVSKQPVDFFKKKYGEKVEFVYNGLEDIEVQNTARQVNKDEPFKLICVGSICERKGQDILIESVKLLDESSRKKFKFYIVGEGDLKGELIKRINNYGLSDNFEFLGLRNDVSSLLKEMDCYVLPSRNEGLPIAIIEALREGLYIIASNVGGIPELLSSDYSELIRPEPEDLKLALQNVISGKIDFNQNSKIAREVFLKNFSLDSMINKYCTILRSL
ncbi:Lipopolysaccharide core biosynthesis protein RfaG [compost metagenome]